MKGNSPMWEPWNILVFKSYRLCQHYPKTMASIISKYCKVEVCLGIKPNLLSIIRWNDVSSEAPVLNSESFMTKKWLKDK